MKTKRKESVMDDREKLAEELKEAYRKIGELTERACAVAVERADYKAALEKVHHKPPKEGEGEQE